MSLTQIYIFCPFFRQARFHIDQTTVYARIPANKKRFWNVRLWLYEGLGELNVLIMLYQRSTLVIYERLAEPNV